MTNIATAVQGAIQLITIGQEIYSQVSQFMDAIESSKESGASKKEWVLAAAKNLIQGVGKNWDKWAKYISDFIDAAKSIYNSLKGLF
jgi:predicted PurR-regulated permease PerM